MLSTPRSPSQQDSAIPFVVFGDDWGRHVSTTQHIFRRLAQKHPVVWLNAINHRTPKLSLADARRAAGKISQMLDARSRRATADSATGNLRDGPAQRTPDVVPPRILPWHNVKPVRYVNTISVLRDVRAALARRGLEKPPILVTATPAIPDVVRQLEAGTKVYFCIDDYAELQGVDRNLVLPLEQETLSAVDGVIATAEWLVATKRPSSGRSFYLPQGVNYEHFAAPRQLPDDLAAIPRPRIGFAGNLAPVCDLDLLRELAANNPRWSIVFVGPVSVDTSSLNFPNVHFLGNRSYASLPAYVQGFDVGLIPYVLNAWTRSVDPLKTLEYLAAGIPVVALPLPELRKYAPPIRIAERSQFRDAVASALASSTSRSDGQVMARQHTWENRADRLFEIVRELSAACAS